MDGVNELWPRQIFGGAGGASLPLLLVLASAHLALPLLCSAGVLGLLAGLLWLALACLLAGWSGAGDGANCEKGK